MKNKIIKTKDCDGNTLNQFDLVENIHQPGKVFRFRYYCGTMVMGDFGGRTMAVFASKIFPDNDLGVYERNCDGRVMAIRKVKK